VPEQVEGEDSVASGDEALRQGLLHPTWKQKTGKKDDRALSRAVLGVDEPLPSVREGVRARLGHDGGLVLEDGVSQAA
jgi:hypothetical protein